MTRTFLNGFGPLTNQFSAIVETTITAFPTGWSAPSSPSPPHGTYWLSADSTATIDQTVGNPVEDVGPYDYGWFSLRGFRLTGTVASGESVRFLELNTQPVDSGAGTLNLRWIYSSSTDKWKLRLTHGTAGSEATLATGTTEFSTAATYNIRVQCDGVNVTVWVNGSQELQAAYHGKIDNRLIRLHASDLNAGQVHFWNRGALNGGTMASDRPGTDVESDHITISGVGSPAQYGSPSNPTDVGFGASTLWDDWDSGAPDGGTYNVGAATFNWTESSALNTHTMDGIVSGVIYRLWSAASGASKTVDNWARLYDGSNSVEIQLPNIGSESFRGRIRVFDTAPDGGAWTQTDIDNLQIGHRVVADNNAHAYVMAVAAEVIAVDDDPPVPAATVVTTSGVALGSSNVGVL